MAAATLIHAMIENRGTRPGSPLTWLEGGDRRELWRAGEGFPEACRGLA